MSGTLLMKLAIIAVYFGIRRIIIVPPFWILAFFIKIGVRIRISFETHSTTSNIISRCYFDLGNSTNVPLLLRTSILVGLLLVLNLRLHLLQFFNLLLG